MALAAFMSCCLSRRNGEMQAHSHCDGEKDIAPVGSQTLIPCVHSSLVAILAPGTWAGSCV
eukprot:5186136-Amphidinium_carterae.1